MLYAVISITFLPLRRVRISVHQKIALFAVFSLVIIIIVFANAHATINTVGVKRQTDLTWMHMRTNIEPNIESNIGT